MRIKLLFFALTSGFGCYARGKAYLGMELEKVAAGIKEEAMLLFWLERASWLASDITVPIFKNSTSKY